MPFLPAAPEKEEISAGVIKWANSSPCRLGEMLQHPHAYKQANSVSLCWLPNTAENEIQVWFMDLIKYFISPHFFTTFFTTFFPR